MNINYKDMNINYKDYVRVFRTMRQSEGFTTSSSVDSIDDTPWSILILIWDLANFPDLVYFYDP